MYSIVLDPNILVAYALNPGRGNIGDLVGRCLRGEIELIVSEHLLDELESVLRRDKFRRWCTLEQVDDFVAAVTLAGRFVDDRPDHLIPLVCTDPDDNYLASLTYDAEAHMLVSGDKAVLKIEYVGVSVVTVIDALASLDFTHEWGAGFLTGSIADAERQIDAEGHRAIIEAYRAFRQVIDEPNAEELLPLIVVPETVDFFVRDLETIREMLAQRGMGTRPIYDSPDVAHIKLPPDPGVMMRATAGVILPPDTILVTMQRCEDLPVLPELPFDHWRVFSIGATEPERIRPRSRL